MLIGLSLVGCLAVPSVEEPVDPVVSVDSDAPDTDDPFHPTHELGVKVPAFVLVDLNPASATAGQNVSSETLAGAPYGLIFLSSQCATVRDVTDDLWAHYEATPGLWEAFPVFAVQSSWSFAAAPDGVAFVVDGNALPYLLDTEQTDLWSAYDALNHDFFAVSADGALEAWLPLYVWPGDSEALFSYLADRSQ